MLDRNSKPSFMLAILFLLIGVLTACSQSESGASKEANPSKDELILAIGGEPEDGFDPTTGWGRYGSPLFQSTLFKYDKDFKVINDLGENYQISDDGLKWTVGIRKDAKFSDGKNVTAEDILFTYETTKDSSSVVDLSNLSGVEALDSHTIQFTLHKPQSSFIYMLISTGIVAKHAYDDRYQENPIGSGPYKLIQWDKGQQLIVEENPFYYGEKPYFKKLTFLFLSEDSAFAAAKAGKVDIVSVPPTYAKEKIKDMKLVKLDTVDNRGIMFPFVPAGEQMDDGAPIGNDVTSDLAIRKAINIGIDRQTLVEGVLEGYGTPAYSVADGLPWWNPDTKIEDNRLEEAIQLLEAAGWKENKQGIREKSGIEASFTLYYPANDQVRQSLSLAFSEMMKNLGIKVTTEGKSWNELEKLMFSNPIMMGWGSYDPIEMYNLYSSKTKGIDYYNANFYENEAVDNYMKLALEAVTPEEANLYWQKAQWDGVTGFSIQGDAPWAWLVNLQHLYFVKEDLELGGQKIQPHGHGWPLTDSVSEWHWRNK